LKHLIDKNTRRRILYMDSVKVPGAGYQFVTGWDPPIHQFTGQVYTRSPQTLQTKTWKPEELDMIWDPSRCKTRV